MRNVIALYKNEDGDICYRQITAKGKEVVETNETGESEYWSGGETITLDKIEEILDREV
jgi:hypothetical protein